jgi:all-trans-retinol dehydrogenase (NAD+)
LEQFAMNRRITIEAGRIILVTGGASGLGRQMALQAASRGASVVIWDLDAAGGERVCDEIRANGGSAQSFVIDITDQNAVDKVAAQSGAVDVVINNAGLVTGEWFLDAPPQKIERLFQVNVLALYWVTRAFLGGMTERNRGGGQRNNSGRPGSPRKGGFGGGGGGGGRSGGGGGRGGGFPR